MDGTWDLRGGKGSMKGLQRNHKRKEGTAEKPVSRAVAGPGQTIAVS